MYISEVVTYGSAWSLLLERHPREFEEIQQAMSLVTKERIEVSEPPRGYRFAGSTAGSPIKTRGCWEAAIAGLGWEESRRAVDGASTRTISMRALGHVKNRVAASLQLSSLALNRWLYTVTPIAIRNGYIDIPIAIMFMASAEQELLGRRGLTRAEFERTRDEFAALAPLSHNSPFIMIGVSNVPAPLKLTELEAEADTTGRQIVINRSIEFPPQYHQAGLGILSYFGTVLREKYPDHNAAVRIEQDGLTVRLIVESNNGDREVIEKALAQYELVVRGDSSPEGFFESKAKVLELKNELRIAQLRIECQKDLIAYQGEELTTLKQLIGNVLANPRAGAMTITVNPSIHITASASSASTVELEIPAISECLQQLIEHAADDPSMHRRLLDMDESVGAISNKQSAQEIKDSPGLKKLGGFLKDIDDSGSTAGRFVRNLRDGIEILQSLAKKYNAIASWCGAPQVPGIFLGP